MGSGAGTPALPTADILASLPHMMDIPLVDELREIRRRLAEQCGGDAHRYAAMLQEFSRTLPGNHVKQPLSPSQSLISEEGIQK